MEKRLRIAHIIQSLNQSKLGGVGTFFKTFIYHLDKEKTDNFVVAYEDAPDRKMFEDWVFPVFSRLQEKTVQPENPVNGTQWLIHTLGYIRPDVLQTHVWHGDTIGRMAGSRVKVPVIVCRENNVTKFVSNKHLAVKRRLAGITDCVVCISEAVKQYVCEVEGIPENITAIIYNGLPLNEYVFNPDHPANHFVYVGRLDSQKAPLRLLEAFSTLAASYQDCQLSLIGDGSLMADCQEYVRSLRLENRIHFLGYQTKPWQYAPPGSIFVHCCDYEGFGTAIAEAMASGHLCVLPKIDGVSEVATEGSEAIFYEGDRHSLVEAMRCALEMPTAQKLQMIQAARSRVERDFDAHRMAEQYLDLYQRLYKKSQKALVFPL